MADEPSAGDAQAAWSLNTIEYTVDKNAEGEYVTTVDTLFAVESITDYVTKEQLSTSDYTVAYFDADGNIVNGSLSAVKSVDGSLGGIPNTAGDYTMLVIKGEYTGLVHNSTLSGTKTVHLNAAGIPYVETPFTIAPKTISVSEAFAYEPVAAGETENFADTNFAYNGSDIKVAFAVDGKQLKDGEYNLVWLKAPVASDDIAYDGNGGWSIPAAKVQPGTYVARISGTETTAEGKTCYSGTKDVTFEVKALDLDSDSLSVAPTTSLQMTGSAFTVAGQLSINGELVAAGNTQLQNDLEIELIAKDDVTASSVSGVGTYTFRISDKNAAPNDRVVGGPVTIEVQVVDAKVAYAYKGQPADKSHPIAINLNYGDAFNADFLKATYDGDKEASFTWKLTDLEGNEVAPADLKHGTYRLALETPVFKMEGKTYAGSETVTVNVTGPNYGDAVAFVLVDGKYLSETATTDTTFEYKGSAFEPTVVAKQGDETLAEGTDYSVELKQGDEAVESIVEPGDYSVVVTFADGSEVATEMAVTKAVVREAKATADFFGIPAEGAAAPSFVGSTKTGDDFDKGTKIELTSDVASVKYYKADEDGAKTGEAIDASELTEAGSYVAEINVLTTVANYKTSATLTAPFVLMETAGYNDVAADAWYADSVYKAKDNLYMEGVAAGVFAPDRAMTRAEFAQVVANMAGVGKAGIGETYPTQFSDVPADAWYAKAIEWAARYGIVTGTSETTFEPNGTVTREQIATMLYRYAGNNAQADLTVLDAFVDGAQVSDWAANAMAWAVEEGYMNGKGADDLQPQATATRAEIATLAVRVQPEAL